MDLILACEYLAIKIVLARMPREEYLFMRSSLSVFLQLLGGIPVEATLQPPQSSLFVYSNTHVDGSAPTVR